MCRCGWIHACEWICLGIWKNFFLFIKCQLYISFSLWCVYYILYAIVRHIAISTFPPKYIDVFTFFVSCILTDIQWTDTVFKLYHATMTFPPIVVVVAHRRESKRTKKQSTGKGDDWGGGGGGWRMGNCYWKPSPKQRNSDCWDRKCVSHWTDI